MLSNKVYDFLKWFTLIFMPALTTFTGVILGCLKVDSEITNVIITIMAGFTTFLGSILGISTVNYRKEK